VAWTRGRPPLHRWSHGGFGALQTKVDQHLAVHDKAVLGEKEADIRDQSPPNEAKSSE
jgi:hypothetical protein